jgi:hypothetical protein
MARSHEAKGHPTKYLHMHDEIAADNPSGMDTLTNPHNFSSNPGFMSTEGMLRASSPAGGGTIRGTLARGSVRPAPAGGGTSRGTLARGFGGIGSPSSP